MAEVIGGSIAMFIFKEGSRNALNESRMEDNFSKNYCKAFKLKLPHMDTVNEVLKVLDESELNQLKKDLLSILFEKKILHKWKFMGRYFKVAVDGTGVHSYKKRHCERCLTKQHKSFEFTQASYEALYLEIGETVKPIKEIIGKTFRKEDKLLLCLTGLVGEAYVKQHKEILLNACEKPGKNGYFHNVLEAKLICENGFSISLGTEWIENENEEFDKQDCEIKAFKRLAENLKSDFPRLPICIVADGLYPNEPVFKICLENDWAFIFVFKAGSLPTLREEINELEACNSSNQKQTAVQKDKIKTVNQFAWIDQLDYRGICVSWVRCVESEYGQEGTLIKETNFEYLASEPATYQATEKIVATGRLRQKIENEGFNTQKNLGYSLKHKYSRTSLRASKNYYQCMQIGHMINQLLELSETMKGQLKEWGTTLAHCWKALIGFMYSGAIDEESMRSHCEKAVHYRYQI